MKALAGHIHEKMLERYSHIRMAAKRRTALSRILRFTGFSFRIAGVRSIPNPKRQS